MQVGFSSTYENFKQPDAPDKSNRPVYAREGLPNLMLWWGAGHWWLGKRSELGMNRGWCKIESEAMEPCDAHKADTWWAVYSSADKKWLDSPMLRASSGQSSAPKKADPSKPKLTASGTWEVEVKVETAAATMTTETMAMQSAGTAAAMEKARVETRAAAQAERVVDLKAEASQGPVDASRHWFQQPRDITTVDCKQQGWLSYLGDGSVPFSRAFHERWFMLWSNGVVEYHRSQPLGEIKYGVGEPAGRFALDEYAAVASAMSRFRGFAFTIEALGKIHVLEAATAAIRNAWIGALTDRKLPPQARLRGHVDEIEERFVDAASTNLVDRQLSIVDPRWDRAGFEHWVSKNAPFVRVAYLRRLKSEGFDNTLLTAPTEELIRRIPKDAGITGTQLFAALSGSLMIERSDAQAELQTLLEVLEFVKQAADDDLVFWDRVCVKPGDLAARDGLFKMFTHYRIQTIVLLAEPSVFDRLETMAYLALVAFCQRIVNASDPHVQAGIKLERILDLPNTLARLRCDSSQEYQRVAYMLEAVIRALEPVSTDEDGFHVFCKEARLVWLRVPYVRKLAARGGPCPRQQDLDASGTIVGRAPRGRKISVSHGWDSSFHISPSGEKLQLLITALDELGADDEEDGVFLDFGSLAQRANDNMPALYFEHNAISGLAMADRTLEERQRFECVRTNLAWGMCRSRVYLCNATVSSLPHPLS